MEFGTILFHEDYVFPDGESARKYLIVLNKPNPNNNDPLIVAKTTSNHIRGETRFGCSKDAATFHIPGKHDYFPIDTWILLYDVQPLLYVDLWKDFHSGLCKKCGSLKIEIQKLLLKCIYENKDIEIQYKKLILQNSPKFK